MCATNRSTGADVDGERVGIRLNLRRCRERDCPGKCVVSRRTAYCTNVERAFSNTITSKGKWLGDNEPATQ